MRPAPQSELTVHSPGVTSSTQKPAALQLEPVGQGRDASHSVVQRWFKHTRPGPHSVLNWQVSSSRRHSPSTQTRPAAQGRVASQVGTSGTTHPPSTQMRSPGHSLERVQPQLTATGAASLGCRHMPPRHSVPLGQLSVLAHSIAQPSAVHEVASLQSNSHSQLAREGGPIGRQPTPSQK